MNSLEIKDKQAQLIKRCQEIVETCKKEIREMSEEESKEFSDAKEEIKSLHDKMETLNRKLTQYEDEIPSLDNEDVKPEGQTEQRTVETNNQNETKSNMKFNLLKELRSAYETGKKIELSESRAYNVGAEGEDVVATDIFDIWEPLRAKNVLVEAGAQYISGIKNNVQIPLMGAVSVAWAGELGAAADGSAGFTKKNLAPKRITAKYPISLELLAQDSIGVEAAVRADIVKALNAKIEETLLGADALDNAPVGLFNAKTVAAGTLNKISRFKDVAELEAKVENANVYGECKYIVSPKAKAALRNMAKSTKSTELVMQGGAIDGTPVLCTSHVKDENIVYGDFSNLVIATWDNVQIDVVRDVASIGNGVVTVVVNAFIDAALVRPAGLVFGTTDSAAV